MASPDPAAIRSEEITSRREMVYHGTGNGFQVHLRQTAGPSPSAPSAAEEALLRRLRSRHCRIDCWPFFFFGGVATAALLAWHGSAPRTVVTAIVLTVAAALAASALDRRLGRVTILYEFDPPCRQAHREACSLFASLRQAGARGTGWSGSDPGAIFPVRFDCRSPAWMRANVVVPGIALHDGVLHFLPDRLLFLAPEGAQPVPYGELRLERRLLSPPASLATRDVLQFSWESSPTWSIAFADPEVLRSLETAVRTLKSGHLPSPVSPQFPSYRGEGADAPNLYYPGAV